MIVLILITLILTDSGLLLAETQRQELRVIRRGAPSVERRQKLGCLHIYGAVVLSVLARS